MAEVYPHRKFRFKAMIGGEDFGGFSEITGIDATFDVIEYREGADKVQTVRKQPGLVKYNNVTLKWGSVDANKFYDWVANLTEGKIERKTLTISLLDTTGANAVLTWTFEYAWPMKYTAPDFNATASEVAIESIEICHEGMTRKIGA